MKTINTKRISILGMGIALYVVLGCIMNIPLLAGTHLHTDLGYIAFGVYCLLFGMWGSIVGIIGCLIESLITSGYVPIGWMIGQLAIGIICGYIYTKSSKKWVHIIATIIAVFIGVAVIKTIIECALFSIPIVVKFPKNFVAFIADTIPMIIGLFVGYRIKRKSN